MFGDTFEAPDDILYGTENTQIQNFYQRRDRNCADSMEMPDLPRERHFAGLRNQGATCYLNSLIQACYMCPEFRKVILSLNLCKDNIDTPSDFLNHPQKHKLLLEFQKLFIRLKIQKVRSVDTGELTKAFGWEENEGLIQQDVQEANRVLFEAIDQALLGTQFNISGLYKATVFHHITCLKCQFQHGHEEFVYDFNVMVQGHKTLEEAMMAYVTAELLNEDNQYFCDLCNCKVDALKGTKIKKMPQILQISLNRFTFDYEKMQRVKVNDKFQFPLEIDVNHFAEGEEEQNLYDLCAVIIHRGNAFGGHYHAYFRDLLNEADWNLQMAEFWQEKEDLKNKQKAKEEKIEKVKESEQKKYDEQVNEVNEVKDEKIVEKDEKDEKGDNNNNKNNNKKGNKKNKDKNNKQQKQQQQQQQQQKQKQKQNTDKQQQTQEQQNDNQNIDFDSIDYPFQSTNPDVYQNWFDFNDTSVTCIPHNRLQSQFQGGESAYILIYRPRTLVPLQETNIPKYLIDYVDKLNQEIQNYRDQYEEAKNWINIQVSDESIIDFDSRLLKQDKYESKERKLRLSTEISQIAKDGFTLVEFIELPNTKLIHFTRALENPQKTLADEEVTHNSTWIYVKDVEKIRFMIGQEKVPFKLKLLHNRKQFSFLIFTSTNMQELKQMIEKETGVSADKQQLKNLNDEQDLTKLEGKTTLADLRLTLESQILVSEKKQEVEKKEDNNQKVEKINEDLISVLVEKGEEYGVTKFYVSLEITLQELIDFLKEGLSLTDQRRLRKLNGGVLFCKKELNEKLKDLNFQDGGIRLSIEKGDLPESGQMSLRVKYNKDIDDIICDPFDTNLEQLKEIICKKLNVESSTHRLYTSDWCEEPVQMLSDEKKLVHKAQLRERDLLVLCHQDTVVACDLESFKLYQTKTGLPDDQAYSLTISIKKEATIRELKEMIVKALDLQVGIEKVRVREINKFYFFCTTLKKLDQQIRKTHFKANNLIVQVLDHEEQLKDNEMLLMLKKRDVINRIYDQGCDFILSTQKGGLKLSDLKQQIRQFAKIDENEKLELAKFQIHEFQWMHLKNEHLNKEFKVQEGDFIGYRVGDYEKDDFQTLEDEELRRKMIEAKKGKHFSSSSGYKEKEQGFKIKLDYLQ